MAVLEGKHWYNALQCKSYKTYAEAEEATKRLAGNHQYSGHKHFVYEAVAEVKVPVPEMEVTKL